MISSHVQNPRLINSLCADVSPAVSRASSADPRLHVWRTASIDSSTPRYSSSSRSNSKRQACTKYHKTVSDIVALNRIALDLEEGARGYQRSEHRPMSRRSAWGPVYSGIARSCTQISCSISHHQIRDSLAHFQAVFTQRGSSAIVDLLSLFYRKYNAVQQPNSKQIR
jgi:hypothetical protein